MHKNLDGGGGWGKGDGRHHALLIQIPMYERTSPDNPFYMFSFNQYAWCPPSNGCRPLPLPPPGQKCTKMQINPGGGGGDSHWTVDTILVKRKCVKRVVKRAWCLQSNGSRPPPTPGLLLIFVYFVPGEGATAIGWWTSYSFDTLSNVPFYTFSINEYGVHRPMAVASPPWIFVHLCILLSREGGDCHWTVDTILIKIIRVKRVVRRCTLVHWNGYQMSVESTVQ